MQRLSMIAFTAFAVLALSGAGFTKKATPAPSLASASTPTPASPASKTFAQSYYWYSAFDGSYNDYETVSYEIWEMEIYYDCTVNTDPAGGTLIEEGYWFNNPDYPASYFLYAHF
jgi:hypothetical protein